MQISKSIDGMGLNGFSTSSLSGKVLTDTYFSQNAEVIVYYRDWEFPKYYIDTSDFNGTYVQFTAYDLCKNGDLPFTTSGYAEFEETVDPETGIKKKTAIEYPVSRILNDAAHQMGFTSCENTCRKSTLKVSEFKDLSLREIFVKASEVNCCVYYCGNDNTLRKSDFGSEAGGITLDPENYSDVIERSVRQVTKVFCEDTKNNKIYEFGGGDHRNSVTVSGDWINAAYASEIASQILGAGSGGGYTYQAFEIEKAIINSNICVTGGVYTSKSKSYRCGNIVISFDALDAYAQLSAPSVTESKASYISKTNRLIGERLKLGTAYNTFFVNQNGAGNRVPIKTTSTYSAESAEEEYKEYLFNTNSEGITTYDGVMNDGKMPDNISAVSESGDFKIQSVIYGSVKCTLKYKESPDGVLSNISYTEEPIGG